MKKLILLTSILYCTGLFGLSISDKIEPTYLNLLVFTLNAHDTDPLAKELDFFIYEAKKPKTVIVHVNQVKVLPKKKRKNLEEEMAQDIKDIVMNYDIKDVLVEFKYHMSYRPAKDSKVRFKLPKNIKHKRTLKTE